MPSKNNPARAAAAAAEPKAAALSLPGLTLTPMSGWENCAPPITIKRGTTRQIGRVELHEQGMVAISKMHCTLEAQASCLVLTATATFNVIVVHTFTGEDKSVESFRRLQKGESVKLEPDDCIYMAVDPRFVVARAPPPREHCAYAFKVVAATAEQVATAAASAQAARVTSTTSSHTPGPDTTASTAASAAPSGLNNTPRKRPASCAPLSGSGIPKARKQEAAQMTAKRSPSNPTQPSAGRSGGPSDTALPEPAGASTPAHTTYTQQKKNGKSSRLLRAPSFAVGDHVHVNRRFAKDGGAGQIKAIDESGESFTIKYTMGGTEKNIPRKALELELDHGFMENEQSSPVRRQRRRTSASSVEDSSPASSTSAGKGAAAAAAGRSQKTAPDKSKGKSKSGTALKTETGTATTASRTRPSLREMKVNGETRKARRSDVGRRVEVHWTTGEPGWYGGTIRGFVNDQFRVEYDDGSEELEALGEDETFFPDPVEETHCQKPPKPSELVLVYDPQLKMPLVCRVVGARPEGGRRVRFIGWSRHNDITCWAKTNEKDSVNVGAYLLDMTQANKQKAVRLNSQISKVDRAQGDTGRARVGSMVTADGLTDEECVWDVAIRQPNPTSDFQLMYLLADKKTWVPESKLLTVDGRSLIQNKSTAKTPRDAAAIDRAESAHEIIAEQLDSDRKAAGAKLAPTAAMENPMSATKVKSEVLFVAAYEEEWDDLAANEQDAARELGWTPEQWDACEDPPSRAQHWDDISPDQRKAATVLGWDSTRWASAPTTKSLSLTDTGAVANPCESVPISASVRSTNILALWVPLCHASRRRSTSLDGNAAQHMKLELDEAVGDDGDLANLPGFLHFIEHNAQLGNLPPKSVYEELLAQLVDADVCAGTGSLTPSVGFGKTDGDIQSHTFSQEMEDEELVEAQNRSRRIATQAQGALHATLHGLLRTASRDVGDTVLAENHAAAASWGWSAVSTSKGGDNASSGPRHDDFQRFERSLSAVYTAVRTAAQPLGTVPAAAADACCGAALFLDFITAVLADSSVKVGAQVPETSMIWQLLYATNPSGSEGQIKQVLQLCIGIVEAASVAFARNDRLSPSMGNSGNDADACRQHMWIAVTAAQRLLGLAVAVGATCHSSNMSYAEDDTTSTVTGGISRFVIAPAQSSLIYQQYLGCLSTPESKKLFFETLSHPALKVHVLDRVLCPGKQSSGDAAIWRRIFSWVHCPSNLRVTAASCSSQHVSQASNSRVARQPERERIERLLILYSAAQEELHKAHHPRDTSGLTVAQPPKGFAKDLEAQQNHLCALLMEGT
eukprot:COSAG02_NODE_539_length_20605_cov_93.802155_7_plen_1307_part_00